MEYLANIAASQPHAAYTAFTHGPASKWTFLARTIPDIADLLQPLEDTIRQSFLPSITRQNAFSNDGRKLMGLPVCLGGLGIGNPCSQRAAQYAMSEKITALLAVLILQQSKSLSAEAKAEQLRAKNEARKLCQQHEEEASSELTNQWQPTESCEVGLRERCIKLTVNSTNS